MSTRITWLLLGMLIGAPAVLCANDSPDERASLKGLGAISLVVEDLAPAAQKYGLTVTLLQNDIKQRLQRAGIAVRQEADPYLYVRITVADAGGLLPLGYAIQVTLMQEVALPRGINPHFQAATWWVSSAGITAADRLSPAVSGKVQEFVDQFIKAYVSVNPKP
jgi:hypothetical protein